MNIRSVVMGFVLAAAVGSAHAQPYPSHPITLIVPFPAGGPTDTLARILAERMRITLGQPVVIETVTGAVRASASFARRDRHPTAIRPCLEIGPAMWGRA